MYHLNLKFTIWLLVLVHTGDVFTYWLLLTNIKDQINLFMRNDICGYTVSRIGEHTKMCISSGVDF